jgi:hypothetical protein
MTHSGPWQSPAPPKPGRSREALLIICGIVLIPIGLFLLFWNGFLIFGGPTRSDAARTSQDLTKHTMAKTRTPAVVGKSDTFIHSCGRPDGFGPKQYQGGTTVHISGVAPADHRRVEKQINAVGDRLANEASPKGSWDVVVSWDSPSSTTGEVDASVDCTNMSRWRAPEHHPARTSLRRPPRSGPHGGPTGPVRPAEPRGWCLCGATCSRRGGVGVKTGGRVSVACVAISSRSYMSA